MAKNKAVLTGDVFLTRGKNQLAGDKAEVDFKTGLSKLVNTGKGSKRVRGLLYPDGRMQMKDGVIKKDAPKGGTQ
jgi:lipopolysaccharide export system protein LptA